MSRTIRLNRIIQRTSEVANDINRFCFSNFPVGQAWVPEINAYRFDEHIEIWVDLAGINKSDIALDVSAKVVRLSGHREPPGPAEGDDSPCRQVLAMEIENGSFTREIELPVTIDRARVTAKQENGLLRITLPFADV